MAVKSYENAAIKLKNALNSIETYEMMYQDGAAIDPADLILSIGEITIAQDVLNDLLYEAVRDAQRREA